MAMNPWAGASVDFSPFLTMAAATAVNVDVDDRGLARGGVRALSSTVPAEGASPRCDQADRAEGAWQMLNLSAVAAPAEQEAAAPQKQLLRIVLLARPNGDG